MKSTYKLFDECYNESGIQHPPNADPINPQNGMLDPCLEGMKEIEKDQELSEMLRRIYRGE